LQASECDQKILTTFINGFNLAFEHLDWLPVRSRLTENSTFCLLNQDEIIAAISVAPENPDFAWLRFFYTLRDGQHSIFFSELIDHTFSWLKNEAVPQIYALGNTEWINNLLISNGFQPASQIISLQASEISQTSAQASSDTLIRPMREVDLSELEALDFTCFVPPWQLNRKSLEKCYTSAAYATIASQNGKIIAYQVTNSHFDRLHMARLAVHPKARGKGLARNLIMDMNDHFSDIPIDSISLNTHSDNYPALNLYRSLGFQQLPELIPVYRKNI
jgi:ribosomal-protein-alanine N-acetyltransferase